jgi:hypothetical protein
LKACRICGATFEAIMCRESNLRRPLRLLDLGPVGRPRNAH